MKRRKGQCEGGRRKKCAGKGGQEMERIRRR
jgi:hypothetical protein